MPVLPWEQEMRALDLDIIRCSLCPRLVAWRQRVAAEKVRRFRGEDYWGKPVPPFGRLDASLVIIGLAPAAHGGNRTGRMFTGDRSGDWLFEALCRYGFANQPASDHPGDGLTLQDCRVTAAVHCAPPANRPTAGEIRNCRVYLMRELGLLERMRVVITLGQIAFRSFLAAWTEMGCRLPAGPSLAFGHGFEYRLSGGLWLLASYHPSQQNTQTGRLRREMFHRVFRSARRKLGGC